VLLSYSESTIECPTQIKLDWFIPPAHSFHSLSLIRSFSPVSTSVNIPARRATLVLRQITLSFNQHKQHACELGSCCASLVHITHNHLFDFPSFPGCSPRCKEPALGTCTLHGLPSWQERAGCRPIFYSPGPTKDSRTSFLTSLGSSFQRLLRRTNISRKSTPTGLEPSSIERCPPRQTPTLAFNRSNWQKIGSGKLELKWLCLALD